MKVSNFILASKNTGKLAEFTLYLGDILHKFPLKPLQVEAESPAETGTTFLDNAVIKALYYSRFCPEDSCVIAEDSGLMVDSLQGDPGVFSSRYAGEQANDEANIDKLMRLLEGQDNRNAHFMTVIALACAGQVITTFSGVVHGRIATRRAGQNGFGYDPVFYYPPLRKCFAELSPQEKNEVSHRAKAMFSLRHFLQQMTTCSR